MRIGAHTRLTRTKAYVSPGPLAQRITVPLIRQCLGDGRLTLRFESVDISVGNGSYVCTIEPPSLFRFIRLMLRPDLNVPRFYVRGYWNCEASKLYDFLFMLLGNSNSIIRKYFEFLNDNNILRDNVFYRLLPIYVNRNTALHYSSNIDFMKTILGDTLLYTCAFFDAENNTLDLAQTSKVLLIGRRLGLTDGDRVLELGSGWGNAAEILSEHFGCHITGVNLTRKQVEYAQRQRTRDTEFVCSSVSGFSPSKTYDKIYSIGMLEHIGRGNHFGFFKKIYGLLSSSGMALIHSIVREERGSTNDWIDRAIFPGGYIPRVSEVVEAIEDADFSLVATHIHSKENYFRTLQSWRTNFYNNEATLRDLLRRELRESEIEEAMRIWDFYLSVSQLGFSKEHGKYQTAQFVIRKRR